MDMDSSSTPHVRGQHYVSFLGPSYEKQVGVGDLGSSEGIVALSSVGVMGFSSSFGTRSPKA